MPPEVADIVHPTLDNIHVGDWNRVREGELAGLRQMVVLYGEAEPLEVTPRIDLYGNTDYPSFDLIDGARRLQAYRTIPGPERERLTCRVVRGVWVIRVVDYRMPTLNQLLRAHWGRRKEWFDLLDSRIGISHQRLHSKIPKATARRRVTITPDCKTANFPDPDNVRKMVLDVLVKRGWLVDDSFKWLDCRDGAPRRAVSNGLVIRIEDIEGV